MCYLIIVALFMGLGKVYSLRGRGGGGGGGGGGWGGGGGGGGILKSLYGRQASKGWNQFLWGT